MAHSLLDWWPVLVGLAAVIVMFADIRSSSRRTADDLKEHRKESAETSKAMGEKLDGVVSNVASLRTDVEVIKATSGSVAPAPPKKTKLRAAR